MRKSALFVLLIAGLSLESGCGGGKAAPAVLISASSSMITVGQSVTLSWSGTNVTSCTASASPSASDWSGPMPTSGTRSVTPASPETNTYTLQCNGAGSVSSQVTVGVSHGFTATGSMGTGRSWHTATLLSDGRILVAGGEDSTNANSPTAELFDPA